MLNYYKYKKIMITGADGFIGKYLNEVLQTHSFVLPILHQQRYAMLNTLIKTREIDTVFHLGAATQVTECLDNPYMTYTKNVKGTYDILEACRNNNVKRIIIASSDKVYGEGSKRKETDKLNGKHPYNISKIACEQIANSYAENYGLNIAITRCANVFGFGDNNYKRLIPEIINSIIKKRQPVLRSNGLSKRDFLYVKDCVEAYLLLGKSDEKGAFNFSMETEITMLSLVEKILELGNSRYKPEILNITKNELEIQSLDCSKAKKILGFNPKYDIKKGLQETLKDYGLT